MRRDQPDHVLTLRAKPHLQDTADDQRFPLGASIITYRKHGVLHALLLLLVTLLRGRGSTALLMSGCGEVQMELPNSMPARLQIL